jgi:uncharacterized membrane protein
MNRAFAFLKTILVGGLLVLLPLGLMAFVVGKALGIMKGLTAPVVRELPEQLHHPTMIAVLLLLAVCFLTGLITRTAFGRRGLAAMESTFLNRIPGYTFLRGITNRFTGEHGEHRFAVCLADIDDTWVPAFVVEDGDDQYCTIFVPSTPTPGAGDIHIILKNRVRILDVPFTQVLGCVTRWGAGSGKLIKALRDSEHRRVAPPTSETSIEQS